MTTFRDLKPGNLFRFTDSKRDQRRLTVVEGEGIKGYITPDHELERVIDWDVEVTRI